MPITNLLPISSADLQRARIELNSILKREASIQAEQDRLNLERQTLVAEARALVSRLEPSAVTDADIARAICTRLGGDFNLLRRRGRAIHNVRIRAACYHELRKLGWSITRIAAVFQRERGAILHSLKNL